MTQNQPNLFDATPDFSRATFDGETYEPARDQVRLSGQLQAVYDVLGDGKWYRLTQLAYLASLQLGGKRVSEASASARLRDLRKPRFGAHTIERRSIGGGLFEYRMLANYGRPGDRLPSPRPPGP